MSLAYFVGWRDPIWGRQVWGSVVVVFVANHRVLEVEFEGQVGFVQVVHVEEALVKWPASQAASFYTLRMWERPFLLVDPNILNNLKTGSKLSLNWRTSCILSDNGLCRRGPVIRLVFISSVLPQRRWWRSREYLHMFQSRIKLCRLGLVARVALSLGCLGRHASSTPHRPRRAPP